MTEKTTPIGVDEKHMEVLLRWLGNITTTVENPDMLTLDYDIGVEQCVKPVYTGELEFNVNIKLYNPTYARTKYGTEGFILPCDKCGMEGLRASGKNDNRDSIFHESDCPYQLEKDAEEVVAIAAIKEADTEFTEGEKS